MNLPDQLKPQKEVVLLVLHLKVEPHPVEVRQPNRLGYLNE